jgi:hypothetical protein
MKGNEYPAPDPNIMLTNITNELSKAHKKFLKEEIMNEHVEIFMEKQQEMVKQNVQDEFKEYQDTTNKKLEKTLQQLNELIEDFNKHQSETKETKKKDI